MSKITHASQLVVGKKYRFESMNTNVFYRGIDPFTPFTLMDSNTSGLIRIRFDGEYNHLDQYFDVIRIIEGRVVVVPFEEKKKVPPSQLSRQCRILLRHLKRSSITQRQALMDHSIMALPRRIADLKEAGYEIESVMKTNPHTGQRYASYYLTDTNIAA